MSKMLDGTVMQSSHVRNHADYSHERINYPVLGVVLSVHSSDDSNLNRSAVVQQNGRGSRWEAEVLVLNDGVDTYWTIPNAIILPSGVSGVDDYHEELPRPCSQMINGSKFTTDMRNVDPTLLDGDWCLITFIGGKITQPAITSWFPHPSNYEDTATLGIDGKTLSQGRRMFKRFAGMEMVITPAGSLHLDTNNSGSSTSGSSTGLSRTTSANGGDVLVSIKPGRQMAVNFNPTVPEATEPSLPQPNPPQGVFVRETDKTTFTMDEDFINAIAGKVVQLIGKQGNASILLGESPDYKALLGEKVQQTFNDLVSKVDALSKQFVLHVHSGGILALGLTGPTSQTGVVPANMPDSDLSEVVKLQ